MKIGKRSVLKVGLANLHYSEYEHSRIEAQTFSIQRPDGTKGTWQAGGLMKSARQLQLLALETFKDAGEDIASIRSNKDFNASAIERMSKEKIEGVTAVLLPAMQSVAKDMLTLAETVTQGFSPVTPRAGNDIAGFLADQELRSLVRGLSSEERRNLMLEARQGGHPDIVEAVLRANPMLSGLNSESAASLARAGIAASRADDLEALRQMLAVYDDVLATTSQVGVALSGMVANSAGYAGRFEKWRSGCDGSEALRAWLDKIPTRNKSKAAPEESEAA
ncbi:hypothetical protein C4K06_4689 [Pseudomonas chlororaphis subsp. aureofaciens]|uniref:hypothetical protein n=1 Tax=Pseudomonas chlororaphis TaxID=587753 RepID=UPI000F56CB0B|nr:hypothetical protein [Pseudomonas chlororaphis]AZE37704.1 hypothetical protein C4K06_4689 [Pseudomonas chlororaphis subsp. aureofaciens]